MSLRKSQVKIRLRKSQVIGIDTGIEIGIDKVPILKGKVKRNLKFESRLSMVSWKGNGLNFDLRRPREMDNENKSFNSVSQF